MADVKWEGDVSTDPTTAGNWSTAAVPAAGEHVVFDGTATGNCAGGAIAADIGSLTITSDCTIDIGTSAAAPLSFTATAGTVLDKGSGTRYLSMLAVPTVVEMGTGTVNLDGLNNVALTIDAPNANVAVGADPWAAASTCEFDSITVEAGSSVKLKKIETVAAGAYALNIRGGTVETWDALTDIRQTGGVWTHQKEATVNLYLTGGECRYNSTGKIDGVAYVKPGGKLDFSYSSLPVTVDACQFEAGSTILDPSGRVTWTAAPEGHNCSIADARIDFGVHKKYTIAAI